MNLNSIKIFIEEGIRVDYAQIRSRFFLFWFNLIPDLYLLTPVRNFILRLGGARVPLFGAYIRSPLTSFSLKNIFIDKGVFINKHAYIAGNARVEIQSGCQIGPFVKIENVNHDLKNQMKPIIFPVMIESNVWIGSNVTLLPNSIISKNSIVAAGAVVSGKIESGFIYGGVPAKIIKKIEL